MIRISLLSGRACCLNCSEDQLIQQVLRQAEDWELLQQFSKSIHFLTKESQHHLIAFSSCSKSSNFFPIQEALQLNLQGLVYQAPLPGSPSLLAPHLRVGDVIQPDTNVTLELLAIVKRSQLVGHNRSTQLLDRKGFGRIDIYFFSQKVS